jgi:hypothetical protein
VPAVFDIEAAGVDTAGSALTGRHQPAAREHSHLFGLSCVRQHLLSSAFDRVANRATDGVMLR